MSNAQVFYSISEKVYSQAQATQCPDMNVGNAGAPTEESKKGWKHIFKK